jgi:ribosomal protein L31
VLDQKLAAQIVNKNVRRVVEIDFSVNDHTAYTGTLNTSNYGRKTSNTRISSVKGWLYCLGHTPVK